MAKPFLTLLLDGACPLGVAMLCCNVKQES